MKKKITLLLIGAMAAITVLGGCSSDGTAGSSSAEDETKEISTKELLSATDYNVKKYVDLMDDYMNLSIELDSDYSVSDEDVQTYIESYILPSYPSYTLTDKTAVEDGDVANIDYVGTVDGEEFDGGSATGYNLTIGSGNFIDGFEDGLIGAEVGSTKELNLTFPDDYTNTDLAGKAVVFTVTVNGIYTANTLTSFDEVTDDYVADALGSYGISTVDDLTAEIKSTLESQNESSKTSDTQTKVLETLVDGCEVTLPDGLLDERVERVMSQIETSAESYDMESEDYVSQYYGYDDMDEFKEYVSETLEEQLVQELILEAIVQDQKATITVGDVNDFVNSYVSYYGYDSKDEFYEAYGGKEMVQLSIAENKMLSEVASNATVTVASDSTSDGSAE